MYVCLRKAIINLNFSGERDGTQGHMNNKQRLYLNTVKNFWTYFYYESSLGEKATRGYQTQQPKHWRLWEKNKHMGARRSLTNLTFR